MHPLLEKYHHHIHIDARFGHFQRKHTGHFTSFAGTPPLIYYAHARLFIFLRSPDMLHHKSITLYRHHKFLYFRHAKRHPATDAAVAYQQYQLQLLHQQC